MPADALATLGPNASADMLMSPKARVFSLQQQNSEELTRSIQKDVLKAVAAKLANIFIREYTTSNYIQCTRIEIT